MKANSIVRVPVSKENFIMCWLEYLKPIHKMSDLEIKIASSFIKRYMELSKKISDEEIIEQIILNKDTKSSIMEECDITYPHLCMVIGNLKKKGIFDNGKINKRYLPKIEDNEQSFQLLLYFDMR